MPSASPAGTRPAVISRAKSCPDKSEVKGRRGAAAAPGTRTAGPIAVNSRPPRANRPRDSRTPTTPWPPSAAHCAVIRSMAASRAWYIASTSGPEDPASPGPAAWASGGAGITPPAAPEAAGQLDPPAEAAA